MLKNRKLTFIRYSQEALGSFPAIQRCFIPRLGGELADRIYFKN